MHCLLRAVFVLTSLTFSFSSQASPGLCDLGLGDNKVLVVQNWTFEPGDLVSYLTLDVSNSSNDNFQEVYTLFEATDRDGNTLFNWEFPPKTTLTANETTKVRISIMLIDDRFKDASRDDVVFDICLLSAVTTDGVNLDFSH